MHPENSDVDQQPVVLIVGDAPDSHALARGLEAVQSKVDDRCALNIDNKYYTATVDLVPCTVEEATSRETYEGIILLSPYGDSKATSVLEGVAQRLLEDGEAIRLFIANRPSAAHSQDHEWETATRYCCAEHLFEYCEACTSDLTYDATIMIDDDFNGIRRVKEALHAHMWPNMKRKARDVNRAPPPQLPAIPPDLHPDLKAQEGEDVENEMAEMDKMENLFELLQGFKERSSAMDADERRDQASAIMLKLMAAMGIDDDVSGSEADSEDEDAQ